MNVTNSIKTEWALEGAVKTEDSCRVTNVGRIEPEGKSTKIRRASGKLRQRESRAINPARDQEGETFCYLIINGSLRLLFTALVRDSARALQVSLVIIMKGINRFATSVMYIL